MWPRLLGQTCSLASRTPVCAVQPRVCFGADLFRGLMCHHLQRLLQRRRLHGLQHLLPPCGCDPGQPCCVQRTMHMEQPPYNADHLPAGAVLGREEAQRLLRKLLLCQGALQGGRRAMRLGGRPHKVTSHPTTQRHSSRQRRFWAAAGAERQTQWSPCIPSPCTGVRQRKDRLGVAEHMW